MLKNFPFKTVILTLIAWMLFWEIKETITGERLFFLVRWMYSDMSHARKIEVLTYLLTDEQVAYMLTHPNETIEQPSSKELNGKNINVVLRIRNRTGGLAWGRLAWKLPGWKWSIVDVHEIPNPNWPQKYGNIIISRGKYIDKDRDNFPPEPVVTEWEELYVYR